ncbi:MAG: hypothetical protein GXY74_04425 [Phycisphaerae bacterium]|nr:hypothetical protein [Phycisphaerae bacterium]
MGITYARGGGIMTVALAVGLALAAVLLSVSRTAGQADRAATSESPYARWSYGPPTDPNWFPIGVWAQNVSDARRYSEAGVTMYVALGGKTNEAQFDELKKHNLYAVCTQNDAGLANLENKTLIGWQQLDEPDIAKSAAFWKEHRPGKSFAEIAAEVWPDAPKRQWAEYGPPYPPKWIQQTYAQWRQKDPNRPVFLNVTFGFFRPYGARMFRKDHPEDYIEYIKGCDIICYDFYPGRGQHPDIDGKFWVVPEGVKRLRQMCEGKRIVWVCIEAMKPFKLHTPRTSKAQVWMSLIHGAQGIVYFVHQMGPPDRGDMFIHNSVFSDKEMLDTFTETNKRILSLAPVLNRPTVSGAVRVASSVPASDEVAKAGLDPIAVMVKRHEENTYVFAVRTEDTPAAARFTVKGVSASGKVEVVGEGREIEMKRGVFTDQFQGLQEHIYRLKK